MRIIKSKPGFSRPLGHRCSKARSLPRQDCPVVCKTIALLHDPVTWYGINYAGMQITPWDFQNKGKSGWIGTSSFVLEVPLRYLRPSKKHLNFFWKVSSLTRVYGAKVMFQHSNKGHGCYHGDTNKLQEQSKPLRRDKSWKRNTDWFAPNKQRTTRITERFSVGQTRYINILTWLRSFQVKHLYLVLFSLYPSHFWELRDKIAFKKFTILTWKPRSHVRILGSLRNDDNDVEDDAK